MANNKSTNTSFRSRNFACVVYPDSAPDNWIDIISELKIPVFISPLHDSDINPDSTPKKSHYHVLICFEGKKSESQVRSVFDTFNGVGFEIVQSVRGYARYLCHLDNPEKFQYSIEDVKSFGGADYSSTIGLPTDRYKAIREMMQFCRTSRITSYAALLDYAAINHYDWFRILCDNGTIVMKEYLKSLTWECKTNSCNYDLETGEILDGFKEDNSIEF